MDHQSLLLVMNPESGTGVTDQALGQIIRTLASDNYDVTLRFTADSGDAKTWFAEGHAAYDALAIAGGDGSIKEAAEGLLSVASTTPLGILPTGSTCDFAESLGIPRDLEKAAQYLVDAGPKKVDAGMANDDPFIYICSFGAFTETSWATSRSSKRTWGHLAYVIDAAKRLTKLRTYQCRITTDQETFEGGWWFGAVMNSRQIGGVVKLPTSDIELDDGRMELLMIREPKDLTSLPSIISDVLSGSYQHPDIIYRHVAHAEFHFDEEVPFTLDGEYGGHHTHVDVQVMHHALTLLAQE